MVSGPPRKSSHAQSSPDRPPPFILGWREWVGLPDLVRSPIKAKLDTGARSSSLHVTGIETYLRDGREWVRFAVGAGRSRNPPLETQAPVSDERVIRDSGGHEHLRVVIETDLEIGGWRWPIEVTLASRSAMRFRMLLGRQALSGRVVIDPHRSYLAGRPRRGLEAG